MGTDVQKTSYRQRLEWLDVAKGITIWLMIIGHMPNYIPAVLREVIYSFHIPFFFMASGYCFKPEKYGLYDFIKQRVRKLLIPYIAFSLACVLMRVVLLPEKADSLRTGMKQIFVDGAGGDIEWFFLALFWTELIAFLISRLNDRKKILAAVSCIVLLGAAMSEVNMVLPLKLSSSCTALAFFCIGWYMRKNSNVKMRILYFAFVWALCFLAMYGSTGETWELVNNECSNIMLGFGSAAAGGILLMKAAFCICKTKFKIFISFFSFVGRKSLWIYPLSSSVPHLAMDVLRSRGVEILHQSVSIKMMIYLLSWAGILGLAKKMDTNRLTHGR